MLQYDWPNNTIIFYHVTCVHLHKMETFSCFSNILVELRFTSFTIVAVSKTFSPTTYFKNLSLLIEQYVAASCWFQMTIQTMSDSGQVHMTKSVWNLLKVRIIILKESWWEFKTIKSISGMFNRLKQSLSQWLYYRGYWKKLWHTSFIEDLNLHAQ